MSDFQPAAQRNSRGGLTVRAVVLGILMVVLVNIGAPYSLFLLHSSLLASDYMPLGVVFPFFLIVLLNIILKLKTPRFALHPSELAIIFIMGLVGSTIPTWGITAYVLSTLAAPYYFASPENRWGEYLVPHIPNWLVPRDIHAIKWFWEGLPPGEQIPWIAWVVPLFWWLVFIGNLLLVYFCIVAIMRKQWVEKERLLFPLMGVPIALIEESDEKALLPPLMKNKVFWIGFIVPLTIVFWNIIHYFVPLFPHISLHGSISIGRGFPQIITIVFFPLIGFAFLVNLDVLLSVWFFYLLSVVQVGIYNRIGFSIGSAEVFCSSYASMGWQTFGAFCVMVLWGLWTARQHLRDVFKKAFNRNSNIDDSAEIVPYRTAVFGLLIGLIFIVSWLHRAGMTYGVLFIFLGAFLILCIGLTRIVIEGGLVFLRGPLIAPVFPIYALGSAAISARSLTALAFTYPWTCDLKNTFIAATAHAAKLGSVVKMRSKTIPKAVFISVLVGVLVSFGYILYTGYHHGGYNFRGFIFDAGGRIPFDNVVGKMRNPSEPDWKRLSFFGIGAVVMVALTFMRYRFIWWPFHPLGFTVASSLQIARSFLSIFIAWLAKVIILKAGGVKLYKQAKPFFFGLMLGYFAGAGISFLIDIIWFPGQGHPIYGA